MIYFYHVFCFLSAIQCCIFFSVFKFLCTSLVCCFSIFPSLSLSYLACLIHLRLASFLLLYLIICLVLIIVFWLQKKTKGIILYMAEPFASSCILVRPFLFCCYYFFLIFFAFSFIIIACCNTSFKMAHKLRTPLALIVSRPLRKHEIVPDA